VGLGIWKNELSGAWNLEKWIIKWGLESGQGDDPSEAMKTTKVYENLDSVWLRVFRKVQHPLCPLAQV
jgi:hypothetical protein